MYKVKVAILFKDKNNITRWNYSFVDWDGQDAESLDEVLNERGKEEQKLLGAMLDVHTKIEKVLFIEQFDITDGKNQCCSCECFFDEFDDGCCPFCGSKYIRIDGDYNG